jgi:hypothetical protein
VTQREKDEGGEEGGMRERDAYLDVGLVKYKSGSCRLCALDLEVSRGSSTKRRTLEGTASIIVPTSLETLGPSVVWGQTRPLELQNRIIVTNNGGGKWVRGV